MANVLRHPAPATLYEEVVRHETLAAISHTCALIADSGETTGQSPKDQRIVKHPGSEQDVCRDPVNFPP